MQLYVLKVYICRILTLLYLFLKLCWFLCQCGLQFVYFVWYITETYCLVLHADNACIFAMIIIGHCLKINTLILLCSFLFKYIASLQYNSISNFHFCIICRCFFQVKHYFAVAYVGSVVCNNKMYRHIKIYYNVACVFDITWISSIEQRELNTTYLLRFE